MMMMTTTTMMCKSNQYCHFEFSLLIPFIRSLGLCFHFCVCVCVDFRLWHFNGFCNQILRSNYISISAFLFWCRKMHKRISSKRAKWLIHKKNGNRNGNAYTIYLSSIVTVTAVLHNLFMCTIYGWCILSLDQSHCGRRHCFVVSLSCRACQMYRRNKRKENPK